MGKDEIRLFSRASAHRTSSGAGSGRPCLVREQHTFSIVCFYGTVTVSRLPKLGTLQRLCFNQIHSVAYLASSPVFYVPADQDCSFHCQNECSRDVPSSCPPQCYLHIPGCPSHAKGFSWLLESQE